MTPIIWAPQAIEDVEAIRAYVARDSPHYADLVVERIVSAVARLPSNPRSGRMVPEVGDESLREVIHGNMAAFLGTAAACVLALISSLLRWHKPGAVYLFAGGALYLVGSLLVTIEFNVPKNEALASVAPADPGSASLWAGYVASWAAWNHLRTAAALAAAASFSIALGY